MEVDESAPKLAEKCAESRLTNIVSIGPDVYVRAITNLGGRTAPIACSSTAEVTSRRAPNIMQKLLEAIAAKRDRLDRLRPLSPEALGNLEHYYDLEITYSSNAIEGNTLTPVETTLVIEQGITIAGKPLRDHLEALDHYDALRWVRELAREKTPVTESDIRNLHRLVLQRSRPDIAGQYANMARYVRTETGRHEFPPPVEIPSLIGDFSAWLRVSPDTPETAFTSHRRLVDVHPFNDGNGRAARLLMNLILIRGGYPPVAVRLEDRLAYILALQQAQAGQGTEDFDTLLYERLDATLGEYLKAFERKQFPGQPR